MNKNKEKMFKHRLDEEASSFIRPLTPGRVAESNRIIYISGFHKYQSNKIHTAKYNVFSFLPKFLFEQFRRYSNIFFLMIALLQQIPNVSPTGRYTTAVPLFTILFVSAVKEVFEDIKRHTADRGVNRAKATVMNKFSNSWEEKHWQDICVGDVVKCSNEQFFPSDILLLSSSEPNGMCYIETANLDGETNLKIRQSLGATYHCVTREQIISDLQMASVECEPPNKHLYEFKGNLKIRDDIIPINPDQILLRGAKLKNTNWIFGVILYTGHETKLMMNSMLQAPLKQSRVEKKTNKHILALFGMLVIIASISAVASLLWNKFRDPWYLNGLDEMNSLPYTFLTFVILYNNLIPISLQVTLEVVRFFQAHFINSDILMYCEETDTPAVARTSNLNEELGQVKYILSDKTGTLTRNVMEFKKCSIAGTVFNITEGQKIIEAMKSSQNPNAHYIREFLTLLAVCHTVVPEKSTNPKDHGINYQAASPDEEALVKGARTIGFEFNTRTPTYVGIDAAGVQERYEILNVIEFTSERKRMSVIVKTMSGNIKIYVKGADSVIYERMEDDRFANITLEHLDHFASDGLRTLCFAYADIEESAYLEWKKSYENALVSPVAREEKIKEVTSKIERRLKLIGATAIEDKLQEGVPEALETLLKAGIKLWVLTGDKQETAINIGHSCRLLKHGNPLIVINEETLDATREAIQESEVNSDAALIVDGKTLKYALSPEIMSEFMSIALACSVVICCRVSPMQKAEMVNLVKESTNSITLAIGDGANDVAMIRAANVGVGISGLEGLQAAHSADYSISQFRFLTRLLLVHGSWSLARLCKVIFYSFYKNIALYVIELWFATLSAWSGQTIFERWTIGLYNVIFTMAPPLVIGIFDRQCSAETMLKYPSLYKYQDSFRSKYFWLWVSAAIWHSLVLFWLTFAAVYHDTLWSNGKADGGYLVFGNMLYTYVVLTVCLKAGIEMSAWNWVTHASIWGSILSWFLFIFCYSKVWPTFPLAPDMVAMDKFLFNSGTFWAALIIIPTCSLMGDLVVKVISRTCFKTHSELVAEMELVSSPTSQTLLAETARLIRNVFDPNKRVKRIRRRTVDAELELHHGYAFSQEEGGAVPQSQLIRVYDSTKIKPSGA